MTKPRLPRLIELRIPPEVLHHIYSYVPHSTPVHPPSPSLQREIKKLQIGTKKTPMYLKDLDDFVLD